MIFWSLFYFIHSRSALLFRSKLLRSRWKCWSRERASVANRNWFD